MLSLQRTLRIPNDGKTYPLPPGLGRFPIYKVSDYKARLPSDWNQQDSFFIPMYQREALWLSFNSHEWKPNAVIIETGHVNAVSGEIESAALNNHPQNYVVCPGQLWLDGINSGSGSIRQFVAMPLGQGLTVEACVTGNEIAGGIQVKVFDAKAGVIPEPPAKPNRQFKIPDNAMASCSMGLAAGGQMKQKIYPDPYGIEVWDQENAGKVNIHIVNSQMFYQITGKKCPPTPVDAATYTNYGLPWFDLYEEYNADLVAPEVLANIKSLEDTDTPLDLNINNDQVRTLSKKK